MIRPEEDEYKGNPLLVYTTKFGKFSFGVWKAKMLLNSLDDIYAFVQKHDPEWVPDNPIITKPDTGVEEDKMGLDEEDELPF